MGALRFHPTREFEQGEGIVALAQLRKSTQDEDFKDFKNVKYLKKSRG